MNIDPTNLLALISELYAVNIRNQQRIAELEAELEGHAGQTEDDEQAEAPASDS